MSKKSPSLSGVINPWRIMKSMITKWGGLDGGRVLCDMEETHQLRSSV